MKMYKNEKTQGLERMILLLELFDKIKCFGFYTFIRVYEFLFSINPAVLF